MPDNQILFQTADEFGPLLVLDDGEQRTLAFGDGDTQSCCLKSTPHIPQYEYTQAMLLVLLFCQPKRVTILGLGGGNLLTALHRQIPGIHITAVELRQAVIDVAYKYFQLPRGKRIQVIQQDANTYLAGDTGRKVDVVFADLYDAEGVDQRQLTADFIARCAGCLKAEGWLVLNCWTEHREDADFLAALRTQFADVRVVLTGSRNWVVLAGKVPDQQSAGALKDKAQRLSADMGFPLQRYLSRKCHLE